MAWIDSIPQLYRNLGIVGGGLVSWFPDILPAEIRETVGAIGLIVMLLAVVGTVIHFVNKWREGRQMTPEVLIVVGLIGAIAFGAVTLGGVFWRLSQTRLSVPVPEATARGKPDISWNFDSGNPCGIRQGDIGG
jgi:hypothetical protein